MTTVRDFLIELSDMDIKLGMEDGNLRCYAPKGILTPDLKAKIQAHKTEIMAQLRQFQTTAAQPIIQSLPRTGPLPLSFAQQRLWFLDQLEDDFTPYNEVYAVGLHRTLDIEVFKQAMTELLRRHETLRTTFVTIEGQPAQVIGEPKLSLTLVDLQALPTEAQEIRLQQLAQEAAQQPFDLSQGPLFRLTLFRRSADHHVLLSVMHHICGDLWSSRILIQELAALYSAFLNNQPSPLPLIPIQYADFARWQREWLQGDVLDRQLDYWRQQLAGAQTVLNLPTDRPRPAQQTFQGQRLTFGIDLDLTQQLRSLSGQYQATLFMTCLAAFNVLLARYSGQPDIVVGTPIANRRFKELEPLIGFFANTLVLRTDLAGNPTFIELLERVKTVTHAAYDHQDLPFEKLIEALNPERTLSHAPLFQVMFALQNIPAQAIELPQLTITDYSIETANVKFDLILQLYESSSGLQGIIEYSTDLFDAATIQRMIGHYQTLLKSLVAYPQTPVAELPLLTTAERQQLLVDWNETATDYPRDKCIHQLFEEQVERTPDAVAVVFEDRPLTYRELNRQANQLAHYLRSLGVAPDILVGICVERSIEMVVGLLGILKAGGAYVPLDPNYPSERLAFMIQDAQLGVLVTQASLLPGLSQQSVDLVCLDTDWPTISVYSPISPVSSIRANHLAYVLYTSGSTGTPKGVLIEHRNVVNFLHVFEAIAPGQPPQRGTSICHITFDVSVWELFSMLCFGGTLHLLDPVSYARADKLADYLLQQEITTAYLHPMTLADVLSYLDQTEHPLRLERLLVGVEPIKQKVLQGFREQSETLRIINGYGPTEATVCATFYPFDEANEPEQPTPIGQPLRNYQIYLLDTNRRPVPIGVPGELYIGGDGLARGYLNRPELTTESFIANRFGEGRLYRTGDLARYRLDGNIEFLGRLDHQVKIRGHRIELGEIEMVLSHHPSVNRCVVLARDDAPGDKRLVAYVVAQPVAAEASSVKVDSQALAPELRQYLKQQLPDYMIPVAFVVLDTLPLTPNGKIDHEALPVPEWQATAAYMAPHTSIEKSLAQIWTEVLGVEQVGIHDNFFERGGDSIISLQIVARAQHAGLQITPRQLFQYQTIAELAAVADTTSGVQAEQGAVVGPVPLTPIQHWFFEPEQAEPHHFNQAVLLELDPQVDPDRLKQTVQALWHHHDMLRLHCRWEGDGWVQEIFAADDSVPFHIIDLSPFSPAARIAALEAEAASLQASFDLSTGPLLRVVLFQMGAEQPARLLIIIHHLAVDGVSWRILLNDLQTGYQQLEQGQPAQLPPKTTAFKTWATWLNETGPDVVAADLEYWRAFKAADPTLPTDGPVGMTQNTVASAAQLTSTLSVEETKQLLHDVPSVYRTRISEVLVTALAQSLTRWSGRSQVLVDLEGHGREIPPGFEATLDISRTVGWFTTLYPVLLTVADDQPGAALKSIKEQLRRIPHNGLSYGLLRYLGQKPALSRLPQAQISFNYLGQFDQLISASDLILGYASENSGPPHSPLTPRRYQLEVNSLIMDGRLQLIWTYNPAIHTAATIERLATGFNQALRDLIAHCRLPEAGGLTPSDFSLISLGEPALTRLLDQVATPAANIEDIYPLSPLQHGLLFETLNAPAAGVYVEQLCMTLSDNLDLAAWQQAWQQVLNRHPALRTSFHWEGVPEPLQVVWRHVDLLWQNEPSLAKSEAVRRLETYLHADRRRGFVLEQAPLMRFALFERQETGYYFVWICHHLLLDGWSMANVMQEIVACYRAASRNEPVSLAPAHPYRDYISWLQQQDEAAAEQYWRRTLTGFTAPTALSAVRPAAPAQPNLTQEHCSNLSPAQTDRLQTLARQHHLTLSTLLQGAWAILLSRYSDADDVLFGGTVSGRPPTLSGIETMVGSFINTVPVRVRVDPQAELLVWLHELQAGQVEQQRYAHSSLVAIQGWSEVARPQPLFISLLILENYPVDVSLQDYRDFLIDLKVVEQPHYPLTMVTSLFEGQLTLNLVYDAHRLDEVVAQQMVTHMQTFLLQMAANPHAVLADLLLRSRAERQQLLANNGGDTRTEYPEDKSTYREYSERYARLGDTRVNLGELEAALLAEPSVAEAVVTVKETETGVSELVVYVVPSDTISVQQLSSQLEASLSAIKPVPIIVPVSNLLLTAQGEIDEPALNKLTVIDSDLAHRFEVALEALPEIEQVAVVIEEHTESLPPLHLSDLIPDGKIQAPAEVESAILPGDHQANGREAEQPEIMALSDGGPLIIPTDAPQTFTEALLRTATQHKDKGIIYIQMDGSAVSQTYAELLAEAKCYLTGLSQQGLQPGDKAILQIASLRDYFPMFWACLLGGITPVTVAIAPIYDEHNGVVSKLFNTWQLLDHPCILASDHLAESLSGLNSFLPMAGLRVVSIAELRSQTPAQKIHQSRPNDIVFLQLTSGSTGVPKAIQETHRAIICHIHASAQFNGRQPDDVSLNWLPVDHVAPILTYHLKNVYLGCQQIQVPTDAILADPLRWLDLIETYRVSHSWSPNFGFKLVSDHLANVQGKSWDLSSAKFFMNGGEQITSAVVRNFLDRVAPFGYPIQAMQPAYGMAEVCTAVTYQSHFDFETGVHWLDRTSLKGRVRRVDPDDPTAVNFIDVGRPIPGVQIRIVDQHNQLLPEGVIGRLQIKGEVVTPGYFNNQTANHEAFVGQGWFNSGDLGCILQGKIIITGREKEMIIIRGTNFYCYEIEDIVNKIPGVEPTYAGACAIDDADTAAEQLAIFFTPVVEGDGPNLRLIETIRTEVTTKLGINPAWIIPVAKQAFPKTTSGKIQRTQLKQSLADGHFREVLKEIDILQQNANTLPDWFYRKIWRRKEIVTSRSQLESETCLVFLDPLGLGVALCTALTHLNQTCIRVEAGAEFEKLGDDHYRLAPQNPEHYQRLLRSLAKAHRTIDQVLHLWTYDRYTGELTNAQALEQAQEQGLYSLLYTVQALVNVQGEEQPVELYLISSHSQAISPTERLAYEKTPILGLIKTIPQEIPALNCRHIDLPAGEIELNVTCVLRELRSISGEAEVAYRDGQRWSACLEKVTFRPEDQQPLPFKPGGMYLLSGGLGGIGLEMARYLLEHYQARLLLLGRTPLPEKSQGATGFEPADPLAQRIEGYPALEQLGGEISYQAVDIADADRLRQAVEQAQSRWGCELAGVIHLAGVFEEQMLAEATNDHLTAVLRPKLLGTWALHQLVKDKPSCLFIHFASVNGFFGGSRVGAYAAANSFMAAFAAFQQSQNVLDSYCFSWSMWDEIGMSRYYQFKELTHKRGYHAIPVEQGLNALLAGLSHGQSQLLVGLDGSHQRIRHQTTLNAYGLQKLTAYFTVGEKDAMDVRLPTPAVHNRFRQPCSCDMVQIEQMPLTDRGDIDREQFIAWGRAEQVAADRNVPRTETERQLATIWQEILGVAQADIHDDFFKLGGHSLLATQVVSRIRGHFHVDLPLRNLFEWPTVAGLAERIDALRADHQPSSAAFPPLVPAPVERYEPFPLTDVQRAYWLGRSEAFVLGQVATHVYIEVEGADLDLSRFEWAWQRLIERHDMLRAVFLPDGRQQILAEVPAYAIKVYDLSEQAEEARREQLEAIRAEMSHQVLPAEQWPLFDLRASRLTGERTRLHFSFDALLADAWSMALLFREWHALYRQPDTALPELEISFRDYVMAEQALAETEVYDQAEAYWFNRLDTLPPAPELPLAQDPVTIEQPRFTRYQSRLAVEMWATLKARAKQAGLSPSAVLLAAFGEVLATWSKSAHFILNLTLFNRLPLHPQVNDIVGDFTSLTLLEVDNRVAESFEERAQRLQQQLWQDLDHRYVGGVRVLQELSRRSSQGEQVLSPVVFTSVLGLENLDRTAFDLSEWGDLEPVYSLSQTPQVWLDHQVSEERGNLVYNWDVVEGLFPSGLVEAMFEAYEMLLTWLADDENAWRQVSQALTPAAQLAQRAALNDTVAPVSEHLLHTLFAERVTRQPEAVAVITPNRRLTYRELFEMSNRIGHLVRQAEERSGHLVAVVMDKGWEQVAAVLGILAGGAAYLPIDPTLPDERRRFLLQEGEVTLVLTQAHLADTLTWPEGVQTLAVDGDDLTGVASRPLPVVQQPTDLAYVIYTSGSTGLPKGVMIDHRGAVNTILDLNERFEIGPQDRILALSNLNFDLSVYDIFGTLAAGGTIVMPAAEGRIDPAHWLDLMRAYQVTLWNSVPALMQMLVDYLGHRMDTSRLEALRLVWLSGDWIPVTLPEQIRAVWPEVQLISMGGATEASIWSILYPIEAVDPTWTSIPYGRPMRNQSWQVLNERLEPCPIWAPGELYIGGIGLAQGYWRDEAKTNARFITHPDTGQRLYKTGDLGRYLPDGNIEFLGREDFQVKIRGHRIELGEIEAALLQHDDIKDGVVAAVGDSRGQQRLIGYVVAAPQPTSELFQEVSGSSDKLQARWQLLAETGLQQAQQTPWSTPTSTFAAWCRHLDNLYLSAVIRAFRHLGLFSAPDEQHNAATMIAQGQIAPRYHKWVKRALNALAEAGWLSRRGAMFETDAGLPETTLEQVWPEVENHAADEFDFGAEFTFPLENLADILTEKIHSAQIYATESTQLSYQIFDYNNEIVQAVMQAVVASLETEARLDILEVGAGYGTCTAYILPVLPPEQTTYTFTDLSPFFLQKARDTFSDYPFVTYDLFDLDIRPQSQGYAPHSYDVVIAASVLHDTRLVKTTLDHLLSLLKPGGVLVMIEQTKFHCFLDLVMGLQQGVDVFEDDELRAAHPLLSGEQWLTILQEVGFKQTVILKQAGSIADFLGNDVIVAQGPASVRQFNSEALSDYLGQKLPDYMVPSHYVQLAALPLTANGKIDRQALPLPQPTQAASARTFVAPRTAMEQQLAAIWATVLEQELVGIHDDFFEVGGDSLLATRLVTQIRDEFEVQLPLRDLFEWPTVAGLAERIDALRADHQPSSATLPELVPAPVERYEPFPLTEVQRAYWLGRSEAFVLGQVATHIYVEVEGPGLDLKRLEWAWQQLIERHDMLRAVFLPDGRQHILAEVPAYAIKVYGLSEQAEEVRRGQLEAIRAEMAHQILPAEQWPLFDLRASRLTGERTRLHFSFDALLADAWSLAVLFREWHAFYRQPDTALPKLEITFRDYVLAEQALVETELYKQAQTYWFNRLDTLPSAPELPLAQDPANIVQPRFKRYQGRLPVATWQALKDRGKQAGLSPSGMLLAAFSEILTTWSKSAHFILNLTLFNRLPLHPQVNDIVGDFTSLTLLEVDNRQAESFAQRAQRLQQQLWQDLDHRLVGGIQVLQELSRRSGQGEPVLSPVVFTSVLGLENLNESDYDLSSWAELEFVFGLSQTPQVWLDHQVSEEQGNLTYNWDVVEGLFPSGLVEAMFEAYETLLTRLADDENAWRQVSQALTPAAQLAQRAALNDTVAPVSEHLLHTLFAERVTRQPEAVAVITPNRRLTYRELFEMSNRIGHLVRQAEERSGHLVAVVMDKGWEQVAAVLGILAGGAAYLPIDPTLPDERRRFLLQEGEVTLALTQAHLADTLTWPEGVQTLTVNDDDLADVDSRPLPVVQQPTDLAYVIYTSGSTGLPKGVMIDHRGAVNTILDLNERFEIGPQDRILALSNLNFDLSVYDIFGTLAAGGTIVMPAPAGRIDPAHWLNLMRDHQVTLWNSVPALMQMLVDYLGSRADRSGLESLRLVWLSGDWIPVTLPEQIRAVWPEVQLISMGGATEASIWSILYPIEAVDPFWTSIPYGKPMRNQSWQVLNERLEPCPIWAPGELYIGGIGLAQGYWRDEAKTNARFITHPDTGQRLYKTGDLGRYLPDGNIEFLGREDFQVKIRGHRIELGEIEAALLQHPAVKETVVSPVSETRGARQLVAYLVATSEADNGHNPEPGMLLDPAARLDFKLKQPGLRNLNGEQHINLPHPDDDAPWRQAFLRRQSYRHFQAEPISLEQVSRWLKSLGQVTFEENPLPKYGYPSAGSLYPVQTYLYLKPDRITALAGGFYYYHPAHHQLVQLAPADDMVGRLFPDFNQPIFDQAAFAVFLVGQLEAITPMYGSLSRDFCLLEAGYMSQSLMLEAPRYQLGLCPIGVLADPDLLQRRLHLDKTHLPLHTLLGGQIEPSQSQQWLTPPAKPQTAGWQEQLQAYLAEKLPDYMIPANFVILPELPLTANGKIDRRALPAPRVQSGSEQEFVPPRTPLEIAVADIWAEVLDLDQVSVHNDFFQVGGDSLLATRLVARIRDEFRIELPLRSLFEWPTVAGLAERIEELTTDHQLLSATLPELVLVPAERYDPFPLTEVQRAYWLGRSEAFVLGQVATHVYLEVEGTGLDLARLEWAWQQLIERHTMLRAVFLPDGQQQILAEVPAYAIKVYDLSEQAEEVRREQLKAIRAEMAHQVLPAEQWPLFDLRASRLTGERTRLHFSFDMLIADAWSLAVLFREWHALYRQPDTVLPKLEITFRDYVLTKQSLTETELYEQAQTYWFNRLDTLPTAPELPLAQDPATVVQPRFKRYQGRLAVESWGFLKDRGKQAGLSPSALLLAVFSEVLATWSKSAHFILNLTLFNRLPLHPQVNDIVGDFTSLTLLEVDYRDQATFAQRAQRLQQQLWQDLDHRYVGGVRVLQELSRRSGQGEQVLSPVVFTSVLGLENLDRTAFDLSEWGDLEPVYSLSQTPQVWLDHQVSETQGHLTYNWDVVEGLFPSGLVEAMFKAYETLLTRLADDENAWQQVSQALTPAAQLAQRAAVNDTTIPVSEHLLHTLFAEQVVQQPEAVAVITPNRRLTYRELFETSNRIGHLVRQAEERSGHLVAVVMDKGWEQVAAVLGILAGGAAYLPIDPTLPDERRRFLLQEGEVSLALTQAHLADTLTWPEGVQTLAVDGDDLTGVASRPLPVVQQPTDLAYVIYTSGSTGLPKGVMIDHRGAVNTILDLNDRFAIGPSDRVLALSNLNFDLSVYDIFGTLAAGGTIVMPAPAGRIDPAHWLNLMRDHQVTLWNSVPALMQMLVDYLGSRADRSGLESLRLVWLSGDWIPVTLPKQIRAVWPEVQLISMGGATEASIWSILYSIEAVNPSWTSIPYGKPMRNQSWQVLNERLEPCPIWAPGELYIGGIGLAQGYWRDEEKTQARFITHPDTGERLYKTGDLGRYLPDGNIEFLGREDFQVKIRGHRIELGEIEAALLQHPAVKETVVSPVSETRGARQLVAYLVPANQADNGHNPEPGMLLDPAARLDFKLKQPGLRNLNGEQHINLPHPDDDAPWRQAFLRRQSYRHFQAEPISLEQVSRWLKSLGQVTFAENPLPKYGYPSAGSLYPVQTYLYLKPDRITSLAGGFYYYHPAQHRLVQLAPTDDATGQLFAEFNQPIFDQAAFAVFLVAQLEAMTPMYGPLSRDFCLLEAGHMSQSLMLEAPHYRLGLCPIGVLADPDLLQRRLHLDETHLPLYTLLGGQIEPSQSQQWLTPPAKPKTAGWQEQLQAYLAEKLPDYMIPTNFVILPELPLTANGKIDRRALPTPRVQSGSEQEFVLPRTPLETVVADIWAKVLDLDQVSVHDDFFEVGGDSLLATRLVTRIRDEFRIELPLRSLFEWPTVAGLAERIEAIDRGMQRLQSLPDQDEEGREEILL